MGDEEYKEIIKVLFMQIKDIVFSEEVLRTFNDEIEKYGELESGGVLIGYVEKSTMYIDKASDGGPNAIHECMYFRADPLYVDMYIDMEIANSSSKYRYIGEWHTHSQVFPEPSDVDLNSIKEIAESSSDFSVLLIIGTSNFKLKKICDHSISLICYKDLEGFFMLKNRVK